MDSQPSSDSEQVPHLLHTTSTPSKFLRPSSSRSVSYTSEASSSCEEARGEVMAEMRAGIAGTRFLETLEIGAPMPSFEELEAFNVFAGSKHLFHDVVTPTSPPTSPPLSPIRNLMPNLVRRISKRNARTPSPQPLPSKGQPKRRSGVWPNVSIDLPISPRPSISSPVSPAISELALPSLRVPVVAPADPKSSKPSSITGSDPGQISRIPFLRTTSQLSSQSVPAGNVFSNGEEPGRIETKPGERGVETREKSVPTRPRPPTRSFSASLVMGLARKVTLVGNLSPGGTKSPHVQRPARSRRVASDDGSHSLHISSPLGVERWAGPRRGESIDLARQLTPDRKERTLFPGAHGFNKDENANGSAVPLPSSSPMQHRKNLSRISESDAEGWAGSIRGKFRKDKAKVSELFAGLAPPESIASWEKLEQCDARSTYSNNTRATPPSGRSQTPVEAGYTPSKSNSSSRPPSPLTFTKKSKSNSVPPSPVQSIILLPGGGAGPGPGPNNQHGSRARCNSTASVPSLLSISRPGTPPLYSRNSSPFLTRTVNSTSAPQDRLSANRKGTGRKTATATANGMGPTTPIGRRTPNEDSPPNPTFQSSSVSLTLSMTNSSTSARDRSDTDDPSETSASSMAPDLDRKSSSASHDGFLRNDGGGSMDVEQLVGGDTPDILYGESFPPSLSYTTPSENDVLKFALAKDTLCLGTTSISPLRGSDPFTVDPDLRDEGSHTPRMDERGQRDSRGDADNGPVPNDDDDGDDDDDDEAEPVVYQRVMPVARSPPSKRDHPRWAKGVPEPSTTRNFVSSGLAGRDREDPRPFPSPFPSAPSSILLGRRDSSSDDEDDPDPDADPVPDHGARMESNDTRVPTSSRFLASRVMEVETW